MRGFVIYTIFLMAFHEAGASLNTGYYVDGGRGSTHSSSAQWYDASIHSGNGHPDSAYWINDPQLHGSNGNWTVNNCHYLDQCSFQQPQQWGGQYQHGWQHQQPAWLHQQPIHHGYHTSTIDTQLILAALQPTHRPRRRSRRGYRGHRRRSGGFSYESATRVSGSLSLNFRRRPDPEPEPVVVVPEPAPAPEPEPATHIPVETPEPATHVPEETPTVATVIPEETPDPTVATEIPEGTPDADEAASLAADGEGLSSLFAESDCTTRLNRGCYQAPGRDSFALGQRIETEEGASVLSPGDCTVLSVSGENSSPLNAGGTLQLQCGDQVVALANMGEIAEEVEVGSAVTRGQTLGTTGTAPSGLPINLGNFEVTVDGGEIAGLCRNTELAEELTSVDPELCSGESPEGGDAELEGTGEVLEDDTTVFPGGDDMAV